MKHRLVSEHGYRALRDLAHQDPQFFLKPDPEQLARRMEAEAEPNEAWSADNIGWSPGDLAAITPPDQPGPHRDANDARLLDRALGALHPHQAADERLWATLNCFHLADYVPIRWDLGRRTQKDEVKFILDHWLRFDRESNAAQRLWCLRRLSRQAAERSKAHDAETMLKHMAGRVGLYHQVLHRPYTAASPRLLAAIYDVALAEGNEHVFGMPYSNQFVKNLLVRAGALALELMPAQQLREAVENSVPAPRTKKKR